MNRFASLIFNEIIKDYRLTISYWMETLLSLGFFTVMYLGLFYGAKSFVPNSQDESFHGLFFGFVLWTFSSQLLVVASQAVSDSTEKGYIEQLYLCSEGMTQIVFASIISGILQSTAIMVVVANLAMLVTGNWVDLNFSTLIPLTLFAGVSLVGLGLAIGGIALLIKRIGTLLMIAQGALIALVSITALPFNGFSYLPFAPGVTLGRMVILENQPIDQASFLIVLLNSVAYFTIGYVIYKFCERTARKKSLIGRY